MPFRIYTVKLINFVCFTFRTSPPQNIIFFHRTPKIINIRVKREHGGTVCMAADVIMHIEMYPDVQIVRHKRVTFC